MSRRVPIPRRLAVLMTLLALLATTSGASPARAVGPKPAAELVAAPEHLPQTPVVDTTPQVVHLTFPVANPADGTRFIDDFLQLRGGGARLHAATDVMAPKHRPLHAAVGGTITFAPNPEPSYGWMVSIRGDDGLRYSYVHLNNDTPTRTAAGAWSDDDAGGIEHAYAPRIVQAIRSTGSANGLRIERGELIGWVGDSGNAKGVAPHLHLEIEVPGPDGPYRINPYHSLRAALDRGDVPGTSTAGAPTPPAAPAAPARATYSDVRDDGAHTRSIVRLTEAGVVTGCDADRYCPHVPVTRGDLAAFLAGARGLATGGTPRFTDVASADRNAAAIAAVVGEGLLGGYGDGRFGPQDPLTRAQLATVLVQGFELPAVPRRAPFADVPANGVHSANIAAAHAAGLTDGCGSGANYCGQDEVTRGQIASFLADALDATS